MFSASGSTALEHNHSKRWRTKLRYDRAIRVRARIRKKRTSGDPLHEQRDLVRSGANLLPWVFDSLRKENSSLRGILYFTTLSRVLGAKCPLLPTIKNGFIVDTTREYFYGDEARVQCNRGYKLSGSNIIQCGPNQRFDNVPTCEGTITDVRQFHFFLLFYDRRLFRCLKRIN